MHTYIDPQRYFKLNFNIISTYLWNAFNCRTRSHTVPQNNYNFQTDLLMMGAGVLYDFGHFIKKSPIRPFVALGCGIFDHSIQKTDFLIIRC